MRIPLRRAGIAVLGAALVLVAVDVTFLHAASSGQPAGSGAAGRNPAAGSEGGPASRPGAGSSGGRPTGDSAPSTTGGAHATPRVSVPPPVTLTGTAALPSAHVQPGYRTPEDAVDGFYQALLGGTPTQACAYATKPCPSFGAAPITGRVSIVAAVSHGGEALVEITGTICRGVSCALLADRVVMPTGTASFGTSWTSLISGVYGWAGSPLPCVQDPATGHWLVKLS